MQIKAHIDRQFWMGAGAIFLVQAILLFLTTPMWDLDTNSYVQGAFTWDIYHNPLPNFYVAAVKKIAANLHLIILGQVLVYALFVTFLMKVLFHRSRLFWIALPFAALEPVTLFYNFSLLSESFFTAFTLGMVAMLVLLFREKRALYAFGFGLMVGLAFLARLSAMIYLPLFGFLLVAGSQNWLHRFRNLGLALVPFLLCYFFVFFGQKILNDGGLYTVKGRVLWDFMSSQYNPDEIEGEEFKRYVHPYILKNGELEPDRELRREQSYLGYKDCVAAWEAAGGDSDAGILRCDSLFGEVGAQIREKHFFAATWHFFTDNLYAITHTSYLDYRYTPNLPFYHAAEEYEWIDGLMEKHFGADAVRMEQKMPKIWRSLGFSNPYMTAMLALMVLLVLISLFKWLRTPKIWEHLLFAIVFLIPLGFYTTYISYRPRFMAPYLVLMLLGIVQLWSKSLLKSYEKMG